MDNIKKDIDNREKRKKELKWELENNEKQLKYYRKEKEKYETKVSDCDYYIKRYKETIDEKKQELEYLERLNTYLITREQLNTLSQNQSWWCPYFATASIFYEIERNELETYTLKEKDNG